MESIRDVLSKLTIQRASSAASTDTSSSHSCPTCGGAGWLRLDVSPGDPRFGTTVPCACKSREIADKTMRALRERSNLRALHDKTFDTFFPSEDNMTAYTRAHDFAEHPFGWLVILGSYGTGKTHLAAAIGNRRLELGEPAVFTVVPDLLDHLRSTFSPTSETSYDDLFQSACNTPLLILDDLGTQTTTPWATEKLFQILNRRSMEKLPTVITTNVPLDEMGDRLASRMADPELSMLVRMAGPDLRAGRDSTPGRVAPSPQAGGRPRPTQRPCS